MHIRIFFLAMFACVQTSFAQIVSITPNFPKITDSITVTYDATRGNAGLKDCTAVYIHSGIITGGASSTGWSNVPMQWGSADTRWRMNNLGNNKFQISYRPTNFYNIPAGTSVYRLGFVFRNRSGSITGKTESNEDIFMPIYQPGQQALTFLEPNNKFLLVNNGALVTYKGAASFPGNLSVSVNGVVTNTASNDTIITGSINTTIGGTKKVMLTHSGTSALADSFFVRINQPTQIAALPQGVEDGINVISPTSVILVLRAPFKNNIYAIGEFNNWALTDENQMKKTPDGKFWWVQLNNLDPSASYAYQYLIDGTLRVADPYSKIILDPDDDPFIPATTYPNLKSYPVGKTTGNVSVFSTASTAYNWQATNYIRPNKTQLVVYELLVRDFATLKSYTMLKDTLGYLKKLGINCIELMPIMEFEGNLSWGYNPSHHFALDKFYGSATSFKMFVDEAHKLGIAVVLDIALNHAYGQSPMVQMYWNSTTNKPADNNPWFNVDAKHDLNVGNDFNHESEDTKYYVRRVIKEWLTEYRVDGFRFDLAKGFTQRNTLGNGGLWHQYDQSRIDLWTSLYTYMQNISPGSYSILEYFADNNEEIALSNVGHLIWTNITNNFNEATMGYTSGSDLSGSYYRNRGWTRPHLVSYMESHDEERLMFKNKTYGNSNGTYNTRDIPTGLNRVKLASCFFFTIPGPKMLWQFNELGYDYSINHCANGTVNNSCRTDAKPIRWDYFTTDRNRRSLYEHFQSLIALRRVEPVFSIDPSLMAVSGVDVKLIKYQSMSRNVIIVGNFGVTTNSTAPGFYSSGKWYEYFTRDSITISNLNASLSLQPGEYRMYSNKRWNTPEYYINVVSNKPIANTTNILSVFPNPSSGIVNFNLGSPNTGLAKYTIVDNLGREIESREISFYNGVATLEYNHLLLKTGMYNIRFFLNSKIYKSTLLVE